MPSVSIPKEYRDLVDEFSVAAETLADYMSALVLEPSPRERAAIYALIVSLLYSLREVAYAWAQQNIESVFQKAYTAANSILDAAGLFDGDGYTAADTETAEAAIRGFQDEIDRAINSVQAEASRGSSRHGLFLLFGGTLLSALVAGKLVGAQKALAVAKLRDIYRNGIVSILCKDGKVRHYSLDYYAVLVANTKLQQAKSDAAIRSVLDAGLDLVRVSPNPSTIGDYCDAYRGRVFSISGTSVQYPPLTSLPGGGCPMHPHCKHFLQPFDGNDSFGPVGQDMLSLGGGASPADYQSAWKERRSG